MKKILVVGSLNMDTVVETVKMPQKGETITGKSVKFVPGGKGANQAFAIGKLGGNISMIGAIADDNAGSVLKENLEKVNVDTLGLEIMKNETTGQAFITVDDSGENSIVLISGTNGLMSTGIIDKNIDKVKDSDIIIMQLEIPLNVVEYVKELAIKYEKTLIIDPAPARNDIPDSFWAGVDYIKPNETELEILVGKKLESTDDYILAAKDMMAKGVKNVLVTLGEKGCLLVTKEHAQLFKGHKVKAVDTTAAGDSFTAAVAISLSKGVDIEKAIEYAQKVSAIVVTRKGAQTSIPTKEELEGMDI